MTPTCEWRKRVRERADREWRELSLDVIDELACHLADRYATALADGAREAEARVTTLEALNAASFLWKGARASSTSAQAGG